MIIGKRKYDSIACWIDVYDVYTAKHNLHVTK